MRRVRGFRRVENYRIKGTPAARERSKNTSASRHFLVSKIQFGNTVRCSAAAGHVPIAFRARRFNFQLPVRASIVARYQISDKHRWRLELAIQEQNGIDPRKQDKRAGASSSNDAAKIRANPHQLIEDQPGNRVQIQEKHVKRLHWAAPPPIPVEALSREIPKTIHNSKTIE